ncbi:MAG: hypothetical protein KIS94_05530 [Chitinophagales bacterium]|nr:hypothetical protein [Chitinophagales bacterium]
MKNYLVPECFIEQELLIIVGYPLKTDINKAIGWSGVIDKIKFDYNERLAIGWIDQDPNERNSRGKGYYEYREHLLPKHNVRLLKKPNKPHYLIEIVDDFEKWFEPIGKQKKVRREDFGIIRSLSSYKRQEIPPKVRSYMEAVISANPIPFNYIKDVISKIKEGKI